ncbi:MAG: hypothetical protein ACXVEF_25900 [Polyangiales bacterium]
MIAVRSVMRRAVLMLSLLATSDGAAPPPHAVADDALVVLRHPEPGVAIEGFAKESSAIAIAKIAGHEIAFVADEEEDAIHTLDLATRTEIARTPVFGGPTQILVVGDRVVASLRRAGSVALLTATAVDRPLRIASTLATADEPIALAHTDSTLFVASGWGRMLEGFSIADGARTFALPLGREPRALAIEGARAFVGYLSEAKVDVIDLGAQALHEAPLETPKRIVEGSFIRSMPSFHCFEGFGDIEGPMLPCHRVRRPVFDTVAARSGRQTYALARMGDRFLIPHLEVGPGDPQIQTGGYGAVEEERLPLELDVASLDVATGVLKPHLLKRFGPDECRLPRAAVQASGTLFVVCAGDNRVASYDAKQDAITPKTRAPIGGGGAAIAEIPGQKKIAVLSTFDRSVRIFDHALAPLATIALSHEGTHLSADAIAGRDLFHRANDPKISADGRACASCHPEGRDDGLVWPTPNGPRQTIFLAGRLAREAPFGWDAEHMTIEAHVKVTVQNLGGTGIGKDDEAKLFAYLTSLRSPPRRELPLDPAAAHGRELFAADSVGCSSCHVEATGYSDHGAYDVKSAGLADRKKSFLVPSLRFLEGSAPYFHDGRYASLDALVRGCDGSMGSTKQLTDVDIRALEAYLRTL